MHTRDYSDVTSRVIDEEVERILREQEARALRLLDEHREGLRLVADAVLFLARANSITGETIAVDGGQHIVWQAAGASEDD